MIRLLAVIELEGHAPRALTHESNAREIVLGRDASANFVVPLSTISRRHARIVETDNVYFLEDLGSTHGTTLNGRRMSAGEKKMLRDGDIIEITKAKITCSIEIEKVAMAEPGESTQAIAVRAVQGILGRLGEAQGEGPFFRVLTGPDEGARFALSGSGVEWSLGRSKDCEFVLNDPNVSRRHAVVKKDWNGITIEDLGSKNGVVINERHIGKSYRLKDRDEVTIGPIKLLYVDPDAELLAALKDVPGFTVDDEVDAMPPVDAEDDPEVGEDADQGVHVPMSNDATAAAEGEEAAQEEEDELESIDPELLQQPQNKGALDWIIIGGVGVLILLSIAVLALIFI